jgi:hypothetical protein
VCVGTQCVPGVATRVVAKIYRSIFFIYVILAHYLRGRRGRILYCASAHRYTRQYTMASQRQLSVIVAVLSLWSLAVVAHLAERRRHARR